MNRKEFLFVVWTKYLRPILFILIILFCIKFLIETFNERSFDEFLNIGTIIILILSIYISTYFLGLFIKSLKTKIVSKLPSSIKLFLRVLNKTLDFILPFILGASIYYFWFEDKPIAIVLALVILIQKISYFIKSEKEDEFRTK